MQMIQMKHSVQCRQDQGLVELQRDILRLCPACEPSAATLYGLNYPHRRAMLALLFCKIPVRDMRRLLWG
jgi:hypothetical protein